MELTEEEYEHVRRTIWDTAYTAGRAAGLAEAEERHCPTCTCGCTCGYGGTHEPENERCDLYRKGGE